MAKTSIEWTDAVWNPVTGCSKVSEGCRNCYAERLWPRLRAMGNTVFKDRNFNDVACHHERLEKPLEWKKPRRIFVNSMSDLFHEDVPEKFIIDVFSVMAEAWNHTFMILTKRPGRMKEVLNSPTIMNDVWLQTTTGLSAEKPVWPLPNVWLGVSVENQAAADERIPLLLQTPAAVRFISAEPLLGPVDISKWSNRFIPWENAGGLNECEHGYAAGIPCPNCSPNLDWVICGGESGPKARPMNPDWVRSLRDQCQEASVPFFFKQWGEFISCQQDEWAGVTYCNDAECKKETASCFTRVGKKKAGRILDGRTWDQFPEIKS